MRQWRLIIHDEPMSGSENMAVDEAILAEVSSGSQLPTLRLYAWSPFCLSLGYGQHASDADLGRLHQSRFDVVRRPTGGKAILHGAEMTYSLSLPISDELAQGDVVESYRRISLALLAALSYLQLMPQSEPAAKGNSGLGPICFEVPSHYEITVEGRKLIGSAQVRRKQGILQHGTLPIEADVAAICDVLRYASDDERTLAKQHVHERALNLHEATGNSEIQWSHVADAYVQGFAETFDVDFIEGHLSNDEQRNALSLIESTYGDPGWTHRR